MGAEIGAIHKKREYNKWADQLAGKDVSGFNISKRLDITSSIRNWPLLEHLVNLKDTDEPMTKRPKLEVK